MATPVRKPGPPWIGPEHEPFLIEPRRTMASRGPLPQPGRWTWIESTVLTLYAVVVALGIAWHEPWADEAQAWLLARDQGFWHLLLHSVRYEGSPGLWHALLWVLARLHVGYTGMHWISGVLAAAGVCVLLRWSPFPLVLRVLLPFGFWLAYQDAVVARSYVLFAVLAFSAAALLRSMAWGAISKRRLVWLALVLGLMANLSVHGLIASLGFAAAAVAVLRRSHTPLRIRWKTAAVVVCAFWIFAVATTVPPPDDSFGAGRNVERSVAKIRADLGDRTARVELASHVFSAALGKVRPGELAPAVIPRPHWTAAQAAWHRFARILALFTYPVSTFRWLALAVCLLAILQAVLFRASLGPIGWVGLLPWLLMVLAFTSMYLAPRHAGMLWTALVAALWITWPAESLTSGRGLGLRRAFVALLILVAVDQIAWTVHAVWDDIHQPYSGDAAMARFLAAQPPGTRIAGFYYHPVGVAAFFPHRIFFNQPHAYWEWREHVRVTPRAPATIATHPDVIVVGAFTSSPRNDNILDDWIAPDPADLDRIPLNDRYGVLRYAEAHGYRETHRFCGHAFMRDGYSEELCEIALQPAR
ncbi:MAG: hypothetical protein WAM56_05060 [Acidobacteriaceae bacterium]